MFISLRQQSYIYQEKHLKLSKTQFLVEFLFLDLQVSVWCFVESYLSFCLFSFDCCLFFVDLRLLTTPLVFLIPLCISLFFLKRYVYCFNIPTYHCMPLVTLKKYRIESENPRIKWLVIQKWLFCNIHGIVDCRCSSYYY